MQNFEPFFVTGAPKSGTTWIGKLLDAHPQINCRGEACIHHFGLALVKTCQGYDELLNTRKAVVSDSNSFPDLTWPDVMAMMRKFIELRFQAIVDPAKADLRFVGEKDPEHSLHFPTLHKLVPEAKYIHIIRDGRGVLLSAWHFNLRAKDPRMAHLSFDDTLDLTAKEWAERVRRARTTGRELGDAYLEIRYEDLALDVVSRFKQVLTFLGADDRDDTVRGCTQAASFEKLSQGRKPGEEDSSSFFRKGDPHDWRNHLTPAQVDRFNLGSGGLLAELGYEL